MNWLKRLLGIGQPPTKRAAMSAAVVDSYVAELKLGLGRWMVEAKTLAGHLRDVAEATSAPPAQLALDPARTNTLSALRQAAVRRQAAIGVVVYAADQSLAFRAGGEPTDGDRLIWQIQPDPSELLKQLRAACSEASARDDLRALEAFFTAHHIPLALLDETRKLVALPTAELLLAAWDWGKAPPAGPQHGSSATGPAPSAAPAEPATGSEAQAHGIGPSVPGTAAPEGSGDPTSRGGRRLVELPRPPWAHEAMCQLRDLLIAAYSTTKSARILASETGILLDHWNDQQAPRHAWTDLLELAMAQRKLLPLLERALGDDRIRAFHDKLERFRDVRVP